MKKPKPITADEIEVVFSDAQTLALVGQDGKAAGLLANALLRAQATLRSYERCGQVK